MVTPMGHQIWLLIISYVLLSFSGVWFMASYNTNKYIHVDSIQAYELYRQHSLDDRHKLSIGHSYVNVVHNHLIWSLMASTRSHISRWPDNVGRRRKDKSNKIVVLD